MYRVNRKSVAAIQGWRFVGWIAASAVGFISQGFCAGVVVMKIIDVWNQSSLSNENF